MSEQNPHELDKEVVQPAKDNFTETSKVVEDKEVRSNMAHWPYLSFLNTNFNISAKNLQSLTDSDPRKSMFQYYTPKVLFTNQMDDESRDWVQHIKHDERIIGTQRPRMRATGGHVSGRAAIELIRRNGGNGGTLTFPLIHTGIHVTMEPANEKQFIDLEFSLQHQATQVGLSTTGLLLNARSGVFSEAMVRFALEHIVSTNYPCGADEIVDTLVEIIDPLDYSTLVWGVLATKFANGHPWEFKCTSNECNEAHTAMLNFARMLWIDKSSLTEKQLNILAGNQKSITDDLLEQYRSEFKSPASKEIKLADDTVIVFGRTSLANYIQTAKRWVDEIERSYTNALSSYTSPKRREQYLDGQIQARRMLKYEHLVSEIRIPGDMEDEYIIIDDRETIRDALIEFSSIDANYAVFEDGANSFIEESTVAVVGYPTQKCKACGYDGTAEHGRHRSIVPISVDRVLFTLVQQRNLVMLEMANV
ncbi:hypothetical protein pVa21_225 [Vibrio phage pVa-21]|nr:hypothetical protein pVa21_225 [Vibrio phage pVa-21]